MPNLSINELSELTGQTRATVKKRLDGVAFLDGPKSAKLYNSKTALPLLFQVQDESGGGKITAQEASRQLTIARKQEIDLNMETARKERIPLETLESINDRVFSNVAGMIKAHEGKVLTPAAIGDLLGELRSVGSAVRDAAK